MNTLFKRKNSDYGNSFEKTWEIFGFDSALIRINDKVNRLNNLRTKTNSVDESIQDTLLDLANYCILSIIELDKHKT